MPPRAPLAALPPDLAPLADPAQPLPPEVSFFPHEAGEVGLAWGLAAVLGAPCMLALMGLLAHTLRNLVAGRPPPLSVGGLSLVILLCGGVLWGTLSHLRAERRLRAERQGPRWRYGLFLTPEALLLRPRKGPPQVVQRAAVRRVFKEQVGGSKHRTTTLRVQHRDAAGQEAWLDIHDEFAAPLSEVSRAAVAWAQP